VPRSVTKAREAATVAREKERRKLANVRAHSAPGSGKGIPEPERSRHIVAEGK
jgi:hypothetical protein